MHKKHIIYAAALALALSGCAHKATETEKPIITVSIEPQRAILENLVGDRYTIQTMLSRGADPETFDPTVASRRMADNSDAYFSIGVFPFEENLRQSLPEKTKYVDVSAGIDRMYGTHGHSHAHSHSHGHEEADPHIWTSVANMKKVAANMTDALCTLDSADAKIYRDRLSILENHLDSLDRALGDKLNGTAGKSFAIWHPSLSYFARDYGLKQISVGHESKEMPAKRLKAVIDSVRSENVTVLFFQKEYDVRQAQSLNDAIGSIFIEIDPMAYDWETELIKISDELTRP